MIKRSIIRHSSLLVLALATAVGCGPGGTVPPPVPPAGGGGGGGGGGGAKPAGGGDTSGASAFDSSKATASLSIKVKLNGEAPKQRPIKMDAMCTGTHTEAVHEEVVVANNGLLANAIVYVSKGADKWKFTAPATTVGLDQKGCQYIPHVVSVSTGQSLSITSSDPFSHNVHGKPSGKSGNKEFNKTQLNDKAPALDVKFDNPELAIAVVCDIHGWMKSFIGVFNHPFHGVSGADGMVALPKLPAGEYEISVWHEKLTAPASQTITVADGETKAIEFTFESK